MTPGAEIEPGPHWWEASALTTAPSPLPHEDFREDFRVDVARRNINKMASKITSASEVNTGFFHQFLFLIYVKVSLSTSLNVAMKVGMIQVIRMSAVVFFRTNPVAKTR